MIAYPKLTVLLITVSSLVNVAEASNLFRECVSPQDGTIGQPYVIRCTANTEFEGIYWFEESDQREPVIRYEEGTKLGRGYENNEYDVESDGSLEIKEVSEKHQMVYKVVVIDKHYNTDERLVTFFAHSEIVEQIPYTDPSHQFGLLGESAIINFSAPLGFQGVYWYDQWNEQDPFIRYEDTTKLGRGYDSEEYDVFPNGSLIIKNVALSHEMIYTVVVIDANFVTKEHKITFSSVVYADQSVPLITNCIPGTYCHVYADDVDNLQCMVVGARPAVKLEWFQKRSGTNATIVSFGFDPIAPEDHTSHLLNSSALLSTVTLSNITHTVFQCKATGPAIKSNPYQQTILLESKQFYKGLKNSSDIETVVTLRSTSLPCDVAGGNSLIIWQVGATVNELETIIYTFKGYEVEYADSEIGINKIGHLILYNTQRYLDKVFLCISVADNDSKFGQIYRISAFRLPTSPVSERKTRKLVTSSLISEPPQHVTTSQPVEVSPVSSFPQPAPSTVPTPVFQSTDHIKGTTVLKGITILKGTTEMQTGTNAIPTNTTTRTVIIVVTVIIAVIAVFAIVMYFKFCRKVNPCNTNEKSGSTAENRETTEMLPKNSSASTATENTKGTGEMEPNNKIGSTAEDRDETKEMLPLNNIGSKEKKNGEQTIKNNSNG